MTLTRPFTNREYRGAKPLTTLTDRFSGPIHITCSQPLSVLILTHSSQKTSSGIGLGRGASNSNIGEVWYGTIRDAHNPH